MHAQSGCSRTSIALPGLLLLFLAAEPVVAQVPLRATEPDTLGLASDAVPLAVQRMRPPERCEIPGHAVVKDRKDMRRLRMYPQCAKVLFPSVAGRTLVGLSLWGDCNGWFRVEAFRSESRREYRVRLWNRYGGCRAMRSGYEWLSLPALPPGWAVSITEATAAEDAPLDNTWRLLRSRQ